MLKTRPPLRFVFRLFLSIIIGVITGFASFALYYLTQFFTKLFLYGMGNLTLPRPGGEVEIVKFDYYFGTVPLFLLPAIGGLIVGFVAYKFAPETAGGGTGKIIEAFHNSRGFVRARVPAIKTVISAVTIGSGGSAGREGPITQIGGGIGSTIATLLKLSDRDRRILLVSGISGGIGSVFLAPLAGAFFGIEVLYKRDYEVDALVPAIASSIIAYIVLEILLSNIAGVPFGKISIFRVPSLSINSPVEYLTYAALGIISGAVGLLYIFSYDFTKRLFKKLRVPDYIKPAIGGLIVGIMGMRIHEVLGIGYGYAQMVLSECTQFTITFLLVLVFAKIFATVLTVGSGGSGGLFAPSLVIGSFLGGAVGLFFNGVMPDIVTQPEAYALIGMASFLSGASKTPLTAIFLVLEITGQYALLPAIMVASTISYIITKDYTLYSNQVPTRVESPAHRNEMIVDLLEDIRVGDAMVSAEDIITVKPDDTAQHVLRLVEKTGHIGYPVVEGGRLVGIITFDDVERVPVENRDRVRVGDIMTTRLIVTYPDEDLRSALTKMVSHNIGRLLVVPRDDESKLLGIITKADILRAYAKVRSQLASS
ncbi:chloride channel protein [Archaeoglobus neptunius]|uniref:chloride channel protein n=1 Tax=Archaeoglobus neptunius TaxID=2798580 RepID=UPI001926432D|nr:chloride channel protein [Archaeoglobus neptunius]